MNPRDRRHKLHEIRSVARELKATAPAAGEVPDLTDAILGRVDAERPFLDSSTRRCLWVGRAAIVATVGVMALSAFLMYRFAPRAVELTPQPAPLTAVVESAEARVQQQVVSVQQSLSGAPQTLAEFVPRLGESDTLGKNQARQCIRLVGPTMPPSVAAVREDDLQITLCSPSGGMDVRVRAASFGPEQQVVVMPGGPLVLFARRTDASSVVMMAREFGAQPPSPRHKGTWESSPTLLNADDDESVVAPR